MLPVCACGTTQALAHTRTRTRGPSPVAAPACRLACARTTTTACTQAEVNEMFDVAKAAQKAWGKTPLWKRAELLHKVATVMREHAQPMADCLVKEVAKPAKDSLTEVARSADLIDYCAEEGVRYLGEGQMLNSDSFPGHGRNKMCLVSKVRRRACLAPMRLFAAGAACVHDLLLWHKLKSTRHDMAWHGVANMRTRINEERMHAAWHCHVLLHAPCGRPAPQVLHACRARCQVHAPCSQNCLRLSLYSQPRDPSRMGGRGHTTYTHVPVRMPACLHTLACVHALALYALYVCRCRWAWCSPSRPLTTPSTSPSPSWRPPSWRATRSCSSRPRRARSRGCT